MGCFGSRFDKRAGALTGHTLDLQFVGGESHEHSGSPVDWFVEAVKAGEPLLSTEFLAQFPVAEGKATDETITKAAIIATHKAVSDLLKKHTEEKAKAADAKDTVIKGTRWGLAAGITQLTAVLEAFTASGVEFPVAEVKPVEGEEVKPAMEEGAEPVMEEVMAEGGEEGDDAAKEGAEPVVDMMGMGDMGGMGAATAVSPGVYDADDFKYEGWESVPAILLKQATVNGYFGDLVKGHIIDWEFNQKKASDHTWSAAAGFITAFVGTSATAETETWFSGHVGDDDLAALTAIKDGPILFPGWVAGWKTEADAIAHVATIDKTHASGNLNGVIFHVTGCPALAFAQCRLYAHRLSGKISANAAKDSNTVFEVAANAHSDKTIADWIKETADAAAAAAAAAAVPATPAPAMEGAAAPEMEGAAAPEMEGAAAPEMEAAAAPEMEAA